MLEEDRVGREVQRIDLIEIRKTLVEQMEEYHENYKEELQLFFEELTVEEQLNKTQMEKAKMEEKLKANEDLCAEVNKKIKENIDLNLKLQKDIPKNQEAIQEIINKEEIGLSGMENQMQKYTEGTECETLSNLILGICLKKGFQYEKALFIIQKSLIEKELNQILVSNIFSYIAIDPRSK